MTTDQDPKLEIIPSQHPVDAIVRAIVAGAEFARRVFDQTKDYEMPPDKEDRENFQSALKVIDTCITETRRLHDEGLLETWEKRNGKPGFVMTIEGLEGLAKNRIQARTTIPFERRNAVYTHQEPGDTSHTTTEGRTPDFEFPGSWVRFEMSKREMEHHIAEEGDVVYLGPGIRREDAHVEVVSNGTTDPESGACLVRALNSHGLKWIMGRPEIVEVVEKASGISESPKMTFATGDWIFFNTPVEDFRARVIDAGLTISEDQLDGDIDLKPCGEPPRTKARSMSLKGRDWLAPLVV